MNTFSPSLSKRKNILKTISHSHSQWKGRIFLAGVLILLALGILSYTVVLLVNHRTSTFGIFIFLCAGVCLACVPFFIGLSVKNTANLNVRCRIPAMQTHHCCWAKMLWNMFFGGLARVSQQPTAVSMQFIKMKTNSFIESTKKILIPLILRKTFAKSKETEVFKCQNGLRKIQQSKRQVRNSPL